MKIEIDKLNEALRAHSSELADLLAASGEVPTSGIRVTAQYNAENDEVTMRFSPTVSAPVTVIASMLVYLDSSRELHLLAGGDSRMGGGHAAFSGSLTRNDIRRLYGGETLGAWVFGRTPDGLIRGDAEVEIPR